MITVTITTVYGKKHTGKWNGNFYKEKDGEAEIYLDGKKYAIDSDEIEKLRGTQNIIIADLERLNNISDSSVLTNVYINDDSLNCLNVGIFSNCDRDNMYTNIVNNFSFMNDNDKFYFVISQSQAKEINNIIKKTYRLTVPYRVFKDIKDWYIHRIFYGTYDSDTKTSVITLTVSDIVELIKYKVISENVLINNNIDIMTDIKDLENIFRKNERKGEISNDVQMFEFMIIVHEKRICADEHVKIAKIINSNIKKRNEFDEFYKNWAV